MAKAHSTPLNDIAIIAANLKDRYKNGFPVLKEIVQNADDAHASSLILGWSPGIEGADHPLLADPALFFINNAPLSEEDVEGILSIGIGTKPGDDNAVGKFGLGMKSLFHLGEVFFYQSFDWHTSPIKADVFNPWDSYRQSWAQVSEQDKQRLEEEVKLIAPLASEDYFVVWVPLRSQSIYQSRDDDENYIILGEDYRRDVPDFISDPGLADKLAGLLPLMKTLRTIELKVKNQGSYQRHAYIALSDEATRPQFTRLQGAGQWQGAIKVARIDSLEVREKFYAGHEVLLNTPAFAALKSQRTWPFSYSREGKKTPDKALPHAAAVMVAEKVPDGLGTLTLEWAVFLPLGEQDTAQHVQKQTFQVPGQYAWHITLHGYFFIDAGRVGIQGLSTLTSPDPLFGADMSPNQDQLVQEWNRLLATQGTLPLLPQTFNLLMTLINASEMDKAALAGGVREVLDKKPGWLEWVTLRHLWLCEMTPNGNRWGLFEASHAVRVLPSAPKGEPHRPWEALPALEQLGVSHRYIVGAEPNLYNGKKNAWQLSEVHALIRAIPSTVLTTQKLIDYVNQWLKTLPVQSDKYSGELIALLKKMLFSIPLVELSRNQTGIREMVARILPTWRYRIAIDRQEQSLWDTFRRINMESLLLPEFLDDKNLPASAYLSWEVVGELLQAMQAQASVSDNFEKLVQGLIFKLSNVDKHELYRRYDTLKIYKVSLPSGASYLETRCRLLELKQKRRAFKRAGAQHFGMGLSVPLQQALAEKEIVLISNDTNQALFGGSDSSEAKECDYAGVIHLLSLHPTLDIPARRVDLLNKLASDAENFGPQERLAYRYLMHGNAEDTGDAQIWKAGKQDSVWARLLRDANAEQARWTIIASEIEQNIGLVPSFEKALKLDSVTPELVIKRFRDSLALQEYDWASEEDAEEILLHAWRLMDQETWRQLILHRVEGENRFTAINECCYLQDTRVELPVALLQKAVFIKPARSETIQGYQERSIPVLNTEHAITLALSQAGPHAYCQFILAQLTRADPCTFKAKTLEALRCQKWLVKGERAIAPENVLAVSAADFPEIARLVEATPSIALFEDLSLDSAAADALSPFVSTGKEAFLRALQAAGTLPEYGIGYALALTDVVLEQASKNRLIFESFDGWRLLIACYKGAGSLEGTEEVNVLSRQKSAGGKIVTSYQCLVDSISPDQCGELRKALLSALCHTLDEPAEVLRTLKLRTTAETWGMANGLCYGVAGVDQNVLLHEHDWAYLQRWLSANDLNVARAEQQNHLSGVEQTAEVLQHYFAAWERWVPRKAIAALLALLSGHQKVRQLCERYLESQSYALFLNDLSRSSTALNHHEDHFKGLSFEQCIAKYAFAVRIYEEDSLQVHSLFGEPLTVALATDLETLFVGAHGYAFYTGASPQIFIRCFSPEQRSPQELLAILKRSTSALMKGVYLQRARLDALWQTFEQAEQLDVNIARVTILNSIVERLKTLGLKNSQLNELMNEYDHELHHLAERSEGKELHSPELTAIVYGIAEAIQEKETLRGEILAAVRKRIDDAQYQATSVPFELFQNADDAVEELHMLDGDTCNDPVHQKFVVKAHDNELSFFHWGREINRFQSVKNEQVAQCHEGFKNDLKKMLALYQSDKDQGVTGKFGLGFKSCLLVTDTPFLLSGRLATKITGGIIPESCDEEQYQHLNSLTGRMSSQGLHPTLIHLPLRENHCVKNVLKNFSNYAGLLTVYARNLRYISVGDQQWSWAPAAYEPVPGVALGSLDLPNRKKIQSSVRVMVFQTDIDGVRCHFTFRLTRKGFRPFDLHIPRLWNLSPLLSESRLGFLLNAEFEVDIGRRQLAIEARRNQGIIQKAGVKLHSLLEQLWLTTERDWNAFTLDWELNPELTFDQFWESVWEVLSAGISHDPQMSEHEKLLQELYHCDNGIKEFYRLYPALPNGFKGGAAGLIRWNDRIRCADELVTSLASDLQDLPAFHKLNAGQCLVADTIGNKLRVTEKVTLETLLNESLPDVQGKDTQHLFPRDAETLSAVFNDAFDERLNEAVIGQDKIDAFRKQLGNLHVQTQKGSSRAINKIVLSHTKGVEHLVSNFAPAEVVISNNYSTQACEFIAWCKRRGQGYTLEELVEWAKRNDLASDAQKQQALCRFLIEGMDGEKLARQLMEGLPPEWLRELKLRPNAFPWPWNATDIASLLQGRLLTDIDRRIALERDIRETPVEYTPHLTHEEAIQRIARWWADNQHNELTRYNTRLYPEGGFDWEALRNPEDEDRANMAWLKLLYLGSCQTIGRTKEEQHSGAMNYFAQRGWWDTFVDPDAASQWLNVMDEYLKEAINGEKYRTWLQILPLYRFSRHLEAYRTLLDSSESFLDNIDDVLRPASSKALSGTGITAPELRATLGTGINFIFRELTRHRVFSDEKIYRHCYSAPERVRRLLKALGCDEIDHSQATPDVSLRLWDFFCAHLGKDAATFNHCFDIPLRILASDSKKGLRVEIFGQDPLEYFS
jgi:hypothetical protein